MRKLLGVLAGIVAGLLSVLFLNILFKWLIASCFIYRPELIFKWSHLSLDLSFTGLSFFPMLLIIVSPLLFSLLMIEISSFILKKQTREFFRINLIIYILINIGFIIINIILGILALIFRSAYTNDWGKFLEAVGYSYNEKLVFMFFVMVLLFAYLNYTTKKTKGFIPVIKKSSEKK
jgi:hypothetical protein